MATTCNAYGDALSSFRTTLGELREELVSFTEERKQRHERLMRLLTQMPAPLDEAPPVNGSAAPAAAAAAAAGYSAAAPAESSAAAAPIAPPTAEALAAAAVSTDGEAGKEEVEKAESEGGSDSDDSFIDGLTSKNLTSRYSQVTESIAAEKMMKEAGLASIGESGEDTFAGFAINQVIPITGRLSEMLGISEATVTKLRCGPEQDRVEVSGRPSGARHQVKASQLAASALGLTPEQAKKLEPTQTAPSIMPASLQKFQVDNLDDVEDPTETSAPLQMYLQNQVEPPSMNEQNESDDEDTGGAVAALTMGMMQKRFGADAPLPAPGADAPMMPRVMGAAGRRQDLKISDDEEDSDCDSDGSFVAELDQAFAACKRQHANDLGSRLFGNSKPQMNNGGSGPLAAMVEGAGKRAATADDVKENTGEQEGSRLNLSKFASAPAAQNIPQQINIRRLGAAAGVTATVSFEDMKKAIQELRFDACARALAGSDANKVTPAADAGTKDAALSLATKLAPGARLNANRFQSVPVRRPF